MFEKPKARAVPPRARVTLNENFELVWCADPEADDAAETGDEDADLTERLIER